MKTKLLLSLIFIAFVSTAFAQSQEGGEINSLIGGKHIRSSGAYGAISNKFTTINGEYANLVEVYGGWYVNQRLLLGVAFAGVTNDLAVAPQHSALPGTRMSYEYGHVGLMTEYVVGSNNTFHLAFQMFTGAGFTFQYVRHTSEYDFYGNDKYNQTHDSNVFFVAEPGVQLEVNVLPWMRFSPGISYRAAFNSNANGLSDSAISGASYNLTLKFGRF